MDAGKYAAKLTDYGISMTRAGNPQVVLRLMLENGNEVYHYMSLSEKAQPYTTKTLVVFGYEGQDLSGIADGPEGGLLNTKKDVEVVMAEDTYNGVSRMKVKWINEVGGASFKGLAKSEAIQVLKGVDLKAHVLELKKQGVGGGNEETPF